MLGTLRFAQPTALFPEDAAALLGDPEPDVQARVRGRLEEFLPTKERREPE